MEYANTVQIVARMVIQSQSSPEGMKLDGADVVKEKMALTRAQAAMAPSIS